MGRKNDSKTKDLNVLDEGVIEGRRTFANMSKYLKMSVSGNFGAV